MSLRDRLRRAWRRLQGFQTCPECGELAMIAEKLPVLFEDEPPMLGRFACESCGFEALGVSKHAIEAGAEQGMDEEEVRGWLLRVRAANYEAGA